MQSNFHTNKMKYVLVSGGVMSGIGKGVVASSIGMLLKAQGLSVTSIKIDPYINIDAGLMSPFEHGEVFVLADGGEADLDLGNYERFLDVTLSRDNNITTGKVYQRVIDKERQGLYFGKTVQVVPHICDEIQAWIERVASRPVRNGVVHDATHRLPPATMMSPPRAFPTSASSSSAALLVTLRVRLSSRRSARCPGASAAPTLSTCTSRSSHRLGRAEDQAHANHCRAVASARSCSPTLSFVAPPSRSVPPPRRRLQCFVR
jgi:hypothetical protein